MRILHVIASMDPRGGGVCEAVRTLYDNLTIIGIRNEVVFLDDPSKDYIINDHRCMNAAGQGVSPWHMSKKLDIWLRENISRFDAVIVHGLWLYHGYAVWKSIKQLKKQNAKVPRLFVMPHGMLDPYFQKAPSRKFKAVRNWIYWKLIENKLIHEADGLLFTCEEEMLLARTTFKPYSPKKELNVGYGIAAPPEYSAEMREAFLAKCPGVKDQPYLLFLSRIHEKKGVDLLIKAYKELAASKNIHDPLPKLIIAGPGLDTPYGRKMQNLVMADPVLKESVYFPGMLTGDAKWCAFYGCEAFVLPSHQENFGIAVVEALSCCKPVLISDKVNIWREIANGNGGLVANDDLNGTVSLFQQFANFTENEKRMMGKSAFNVYCQHYRVEVAANRFAEACLSSS